MLVHGSSVRPRPRYPSGRENRPIVLARVGDAATHALLGHGDAGVGGAAGGDGGVPSGGRVGAARGQGDGRTVSRGGSAW